MAPSEAQVKTIDGRARSVRELLDKAKYAIDFYQREYAWQERQVRELLDDLTGKFLDSYEPGHSRHEVEGYDHYFLGSIVISHKRGQRFVVDGQQRLTTLTLLLIHLHRLQEDQDERVEVQNLVYSEKYGRKSFNLDVPERVEVMQKLMDRQPIDLNGESESVRNIVARHANIADHLPEEVTGSALPYFVDWLLENVHLVEIEAFSDEDAYTIFETMNDRGLSLSLPEMLKGYVLANVRHEDDQRSVNETWKRHMQHLKELGGEEDVDFFKNWLRAQHAETIRPGRKGAENRDYERIGSEFHRWVRDHREQLELANPDAFVRLVSRDLDFYARHSIAIRKAARVLKPGWESIRYNEDRGFTLQTQALLAALTPDDDTDRDPTEGRTRGGLSRHLARATRLELSNDQLLFGQVHALHPDQGVTRAGYGQSVGVPARAARRAARKLRAPTPVPVAQSELPAGTAHPRSTDALGGHTVRPLIEL